MPSPERTVEARSQPQGRRLYRAFGRLIAADAPIRLAAPPPVAPGDPDVILTQREDAPRADWQAAVERYATPPAQGRDQPDFRFLELPDRAIVRIEGSADVHVRDAAIVFHLREPSRAFLAEIVLSGLGLALWFERSGIATLHGSAADIDGQGVGFLATGGTGKSSLVAYLTALGHPLITEDLLVTSWEADTPRVEPGLSQLRLWPEQAARYVADWQSLDQPHPGFSKRRLPVGESGLGRLASHAVPLRRLYVLERTDHPNFEVSLTETSGSDGLWYLLHHSYLSEVGEGFGWQARRLVQLARLLGKAPVRLLRFRSGEDQLPAIRAAILADLAR